MKKKYMIPTLEVIKIKTDLMLVSSPNLDGGDFGEGDPVLAPGLGSMEW